MKKAREERVKKSEENRKKKTKMVERRKEKMRKDDENKDKDEWTSGCGNMGRKGKVLRKEKYTFGFGPHSSLIREVGKILVRVTSDYCQSYLL